MTTLGKKGAIDKENLEKMVESEITSDGLLQPQCSANVKRDNHRFLRAL